MTQLKIKIPAQTVSVNLEDWALSYGLEPDTKTVRRDVKEYFGWYAQQIIDGMELNDQ